MGKSMKQTNNVSATTIEFLAKRNNKGQSLAAINSAILAGMPILIGYTNRNLRFGEVAEGCLHIGGKPIAWPVGYASPSTVAKELQEHAASLGRRAKIGLCLVAHEMHQTGASWWCEGSHLNAFKVESWY